MVARRLRAVEITEVGSGPQQANPDDLRIKELLARVETGKFSEIILALAADVEGEATTNYLVELLKPFPVSLTRIAHGLPAGGGLESADELTLYQALSGRTKL